MIVAFKEKANPDLIKSYGGRIRHVYHIIPGVAASLSGESIQELAKMKQVGHIELDKRVKALRNQKRLNARESIIRGLYNAWKSWRKN